MRLLLTAALALALPLHAETYKWVDEKGVTHYSSTPPAGAVKATMIEERVSVMPSDPSLQTGIADMRAQALRRQEYVEQEYLQRQRLSIEKDMLAMTIPQCPYRAECGDGFVPYAYPWYGYGGYPVYYGGPVLRSPGHGPGMRAGFYGRPSPVATRGSSVGLGFGFSGGRR
ncbi:MAG TPA: DUF4124 domain-containing protein [Burkholderiales bacterium]|nr:DUF4124 domain-containing protein [Burkholderiales bacterium]